MMKVNSSPSLWSPIPQPIAVLAGRFSEAIVEEYDATAVLHGAQEGPARKPQHVFEFEQGIRLIISIDKIGAEAKLHVSASFNRERAMSFIADGRLDQKKAIDFALGALNQITPSKLQVDFLGMTSSGVFHFIGKVPS